MATTNCFLQRYRKAQLWFCVAAAIVSWSPISVTHAEVADNSLRVYAVNILRHPKEPWTGYGIYLGNGFVISAAHVVGRSFLTRPSVLIAGLDLSAKVDQRGFIRRCGPDIAFHRPREIADQPASTPSVDM